MTKARSERSRAGRERRLIAKELLELVAFLVLVATMPLLFGLERATNTTLLMLGLGWLVVRASVYGVTAWRRRRRAEQPRV